jgi:hypothetical protein
MKWRWKRDREIKIRFFENTEHPRIQITGNIP